MAITRRICKRQTLFVHFRISPLLSSWKRDLILNFCTLLFFRGIIFFKLKQPFSFFLFFFPRSQNIWREFQGGRSNTPRNFVSFFVFYDVTIENMFPFRQIITISRQVKSATPAFGRETNAWITAVNPRSITMRSSTLSTLSNPPQRQSRCYGSNERQAASHSHKFLIGWPGPDRILYPRVI